MNLFTFNSKLIRVLFFFFILYSLYNIFLYYFSPDTQILYLSPKSKNIITGESYLYNHKPIVIVGSSLSTYILDEYLEANVFNLSLNGDSAITGLTLIKKSGNIPEFIFIEKSSSAIFRKKNTFLIDTLFKPIIYDLKRFIPSFKEKNKPLNIIMSFLKINFGASHFEKVNQETDNDKLMKALDIAKIKHEKLLEDPDKKIFEFKQLVEYFVSEGTQVFFFIMPIHKDLENSNLNIQAMETIRKHFVSIPTLKLKKNIYHTTDGLHLDYKSSIIFSENFSYALDSITK